MSIKTPEQIAAELHYRICEYLQETCGIALSEAEAFPIKGSIEMALTEHAKGLEEKAHGFKLCFPYETIGNMNPALFKDGGYHYYVPEAERNQLRAALDMQTKNYLALCDAVLGDGATTSDVKDPKAIALGLNAEIESLKTTNRNLGELVEELATERDQLRARVPELELKTFDIKKLEADEARLDWLERHSCAFPTDNIQTIKFETPRQNTDDYEKPTVRAAIDAARKEGTS